MELRLNVVTHKKVETKALGELDSLLRDLVPGWNPMTKFTFTAVITVPENFTVKQYDEAVALLREGLEEKGYSNTTITREEPA